MAPYGMFWPSYGMRFVSAEDYAHTKVSNIGVCIGISGPAGTGMIIGPTPRKPIGTHSVHARIKSLRVYQEINLSAWPSQHTFTARPLRLPICKCVNVWPAIACFPERCSRNVYIAINDNAN
jgi:hypothetical protein